MDVDCTTRTSPADAAAQPASCPAELVCQTALHTLAPGAQATILCVNCPARMRRRLAEMGVLPGVRVQMKRTAPLGDPIAFQVKGYQLSLRRADAALILVQPDAAQKAATA